MNNNSYSIDDLLGDNPVMLALGEPVPSFPDIAGGDGVSPSAIESGSLEGNMVVEDGYIQSSNFVTGSTGWQLTPDSAEFNVGVSVDELHIPDETTADSFHVETDGDSYWGCNVASWAADTDNANAYILKDGSAKFQNIVLTGVAIGTDISILEFSHDLEFTSISDDEVQWSDGTITMSNGETFDIAGGVKSATQIDIFEHDIVYGRYSDLIKIDATHFMLAYSSDGNDAFLKTFSIDANYDVTEIASLEHDAVYGVNQSLVMIDATHFIVAYRATNSNVGYIKTFSIDGNYENITEIASLEHESGFAETNSLVMVDSTHFILAYTSYSGTGYIKTFSIDGSYGTITEIDSLSNPCSYGAIISLIKIDATHYFLAYSDATISAVVKTILLDGSYNISTINSLGHGSNGTHSSCVMIDATHFMLAFAGAESDGYIKTFSIDGSYAITEIDSLEHDAVIGFYPSLVKIDATHYALAYSGSFEGNLSYGYIKVFSIDSGYVITETGSLKHDTEKVQENSLVMIDSTHVMLAYSDVATTDGFIKTFSLAETTSGTLTAGEVVYFDTGVSETQLQTSASPADAVGANKILLGYAEASTDPAGYASFVPAKGLGGISTNSDQLNVSNLAEINTDLGNIVAGTITFNTSSYIKGGQTAFQTGTGFWMGYAGAAYKMSIGTAAADRLVWDGTDLVFVGTLSGKVNGGLNLDLIPDTDLTANGNTSDSLNAGVTVTQFQVCYLATDGEWALADASTSATVEKMLSVALEAGTDGNAMLVAMRGCAIRNDAWTWTIGAPIYLSETEGVLTQTEPTTTGAYSIVLGYAISADVMIFDPEEANLIP